MKHEIARNSFFYKCYLKGYLKDLQEIDDLISSLSSYKEGILSDIVNNFRDIPLFSGYVLTDFGYKSIGRYFKFHKAFYITVKEKLFIQKLRDLRNVREQLYLAERNKKNLQRKFVTEKQFKFVTEETNRIMLDLIIKTGGTYIIHSELGHFAVTKKIHRKPKGVLNFEETMKLKKEILARGGTLHSKENPTGERYRVFYIEPVYCRLKWFRTTPLLINDFSDYRFFEAKGNYRVAKKVFDHINENPEAKDLYRTNQRTT